MLFDIVTVLVQMPNRHWVYRDDVQGHVQARDWVISESLKICHTKEYKNRQRLPLSLVLYLSNLEGAKNIRSPKLPRTNSSLYFSFCLIFESVSFLAKLMLNYTEHKIS